MDRVFSTRVFLITISIAGPFIVSRSLFERCVDAFWARLPYVIQWPY